MMSNLHDPYCPHAVPDGQSGRCVCRYLDYARQDEREIAVSIMNSYIQSFKNGFSYDQWENMVNDVLTGNEDGNS